jgi:hypothetical protein
MRKFTTVLAFAAALAAAPGVVGAAPIQPASCGQGAQYYECDIFADYGSGISELGSLEGNLGGYLPTYSYLLNTTADLSDGLSVSEVAHILVVEDQLFRLISNIAPLMNFGTYFDAALATAPGVQILGCPVPNGVLQYQNVGYCTTADLVTLFPNWAAFDTDGNPIGGSDLLRINTALLNTSNPVPEPGTLTLMGLGGALAALRRRRNRRNLAP